MMSPPPSTCTAPFTTVNALTTTTPPLHPPPPLLPAPLTPMQVLNDESPTLNIYFTFQQSTPPDPRPLLPLATTPPLPLQPQRRYSMTSPTPSTCMAPMLRLTTGATR